MKNSSYDEAKSIFQKMTGRQLKDFIPTSLTQVDLNYLDKFLQSKLSLPLSLSKPLLVSSDPFADMKIQCDLRFLFQIQKGRGLEIQVSSSSKLSTSINLNNTSIPISQHPSTLFISFLNLDRSTLSFSSNSLSFSFSTSSKFPPSIS